LVDRIWHVTFNPNKPDVVIFSGILPALELNVAVDLFVFFKIVH